MRERGGDDWKVKVPSHKCRERRGRRKKERRGR